MALGGVFGSNGGGGGGGGGETAQLVSLLDFNNANQVTYIGLTTPGNQTNTSASVWQITQLTYTAGGNPIGGAFANGEPTFVNVWNNRASYSYS